MERGAVTKSQKREESQRREENWRVFSVEGTRTMFQRRLMQFQSWHNSLRKQWRRSETERTIVFSRTKFEGKIDWRRGTKNPQQNQATEMKALQKRSEIPCRCRICKKNRHVIFGILPCVRITRLKKDVHPWRQNAISEMSRQKERLSCDIEGVFTIGWCISRFLSEKICSRWTWNVGITSSNYPMAPGTESKLGKEKGPSRGIIQKCAPHERSPCAPKFEDRSLEETVHQEGCARKAAWDLAKKTQEFGQSYVLFSWWSKGNVDTCRFKETRRARVRCPFRSINAQQTWAQMNWILCEDPGTALWCLQPMEKCIQTRKHKYTFMTSISSWQCKYSKKRLLFYRLENSAKTSDILGSAVKNHGGPEVPIRRQHRHCRICHQQVQSKSEVTN